MECRLRELRIKRGLNQTGMAMILNVSQQTISRIESGESQIPVDLALRAAEYFHVSMDYMLGLSDEINNTTGTRKDLHMLKTALSIKNKRKSLSIKNKPEFHLTTATR